MCWIEMGRFQLLKFNQKKCSVSEGGIIMMEMGYV